MYYKLKSIKNVINSHYKNSLSYYFKATNDSVKLMILMSKLEKRFDKNRFKIFIKRSEQKLYRNKTDFSPLIEPLFNMKVPETRDILKVEIDEVLDNTLGKFGYKLNEDYVYINNDLRTLVSNDKIVIINNKKYSLSLHNMFYNISLYKKDLKEYKQTNINNELKLKDKGTAYSSNRDASEVTNPVLNDLEATLNFLEDNIEVEAMSNLIKAFNIDSHKVVGVLSMLGEKTLEYLKDEKDKQLMKTILKSKKLLNASQGLKNEDFYHSLRFKIASLFAFGKPNKYGFSSKPKFTNFLNDVLEHIVDIDYIKFDQRDFNDDIQYKDTFNNRSVLIEKITPTNKKDHPILDDPTFLFLLKDSLKKTCIYYK